MTAPSRSSSRTPSLRMRLLVVVVLAVGAWCATAGMAWAVPGATDPQYGVRGVAPSGDQRHLSFGGASAVQLDGKLLVAGASTSIDAGIDEDDDDLSLDIRVHPVVTRTLADGSLDPTWGTRGRAAIYLQNHLSIATSIEPLPGGGALVTGANVGFLSATAFVAKLDPAGRLDTTFGQGGFATALPEDMNALVPLAAHQQPDGRVLVVADSFTGDLLSFDADAKRQKADFDVVLLRYLASGVLDPAFGAGGVVRWESHGANSLDIGLVARFASDGSPTVAGSSVSDKLTFARALVARFTPDGVLDARFGHAGIASPVAKLHRWEAVTALEQRTEGGIGFGVVRLDESDEGDEAFSTFVRSLSGAGTPRSSHPLPEQLIPTTVLTLADGRVMVGGVGARGGSAESDDGFQAAVARLSATGAPDTRFDRHGVSYYGVAGDLFHGSIVDGLHPGPAGSVIASGTFDGKLGSVRVFGDDPAGAASRPSSLVLHVVPSASGRGCGRIARAACDVARERAGRVLLRAATRGVPVGTRLRVTEEYFDEGDWYSDETHEMVVHRGGVAALDISDLKFDDYSAFHRYRVEVPTTTSHLSTAATAYARATGHNHGAANAPARVAAPIRSSMCTTRVRNTLTADVHAACVQVAAQRTAPGDWRVRARRWLGR